MSASNTIISTLDTVWFIIKWFWWFGLLIGLFIMKKLYSRFPIEAIIFEKRGKNLIKTNDRCGKYIDPLTGLQGYKLSSTKETIPVLDFDWVIHNNVKHMSIFERLVHYLRGNAGTVFLFKYGSRQYKPIQVEQNGKVEIKWEEVKDAKGNPILVSIYKPIDPRDKMAGLDFEVVDWDNMNFMVQEQRASIERRKKKSEIWKQILIPALLIGAAIVISIVMIKYGYDAMNSMLARGSPVVQETPKTTGANVPVISNLLPK